MDRRLAPQVTARILNSERAYLLGWERLPASEGGGWGARIAWIELSEEGAWFAKGGVVPAGDVKPVEGQDYSSVPRDPTPTDPSDPRDPKSPKERRGEHERAYFDERLRRSPGREEFAEYQRRLDGPF